MISRLLFRLGTFFISAAVVLKVLGLTILAAIVLICLLVS